MYNFSDLFPPGRKRALSVERKPGLLRISYLKAKRAEDSSVVLEQDRETKKKKKKKKKRKEKKRKAKGFRATLSVLELTMNREHQVD